MEKQIRGRDQFRKVKKILAVAVVIYRLLPMKVRIHILKRHRNTRGKLGMGLRWALLKSIAEYCGDNVAIYSGVYLLSPERLCIGSNVSIQPMAYVDCSGGLQIDDDVSIAHGVTVITTTHIFEDKAVCIKDQGIEKKPVHSVDRCEGNCAGRGEYCLWLCDCCQCSSNKEHRGE